SSFTKFEISGPRACSFLQYLAVANVDKQPGGATYTQLCNERGGIEADVTIIRRSEDCFWLITGSAFGIRDRHWIESQLHGNPGRHVAHRRSGDEQWSRSGEPWTRSGGQPIRSKSPKFNQVEIRDITSNYGVINLAGPLARQVLAKVCDDDVSHDGFPFMAARDIRIGYAPALAYRVTYIGELGWELYIPTEYLQYVFEELQAAGEEFGITNIGYRAVDSLRLEKRYLAWGVDITPDYNPYEAGLQFLIDWDKGDFSGAEALARIRQEGVQQKLVCLALNDPLPVFGGEAIFCGDQVVAQTTSGNFGYSTGKSLVLGYLPVDVLDHSNLMVEAFGKRSSASIVKGAI
ncbi:MAG: aminomethyltransferase family protein, partial [Lysobacterales bacterium]